MRFAFPAWDVGKDFLEERPAPSARDGDAGWKRETTMAKNAGIPTIAANLAVLHHVSLPVSDLARSVAFYRDVLGLRQIDRPGFDFKGAWFAIGSEQQIHLIKDEGLTFRTGKGIDGRDIHFAIRVGSYRSALLHLIAKGYGMQGKPGLDEFQSLKVKPRAAAGFPQIYIIDPDRNLIEINSDELDITEDEISSLLH
jgi:glyoxylase I family protein